MLTISKLQKEKILSFKQGKKAKSKLISLILSELQLKEKSGHAVTESDAVNQIFSISKQVKANIEFCVSNGRSDDKDVYESELKILDEILALASTRMLSESDIDDIIQNLNATGMKDMGKVMGFMKKNHSGAFDPSVASAYIKSKLAS